MPRLSTSLLRNAKAIDPLLPSLLRPCRTLQAAQNELRWLREHVLGDHRTRNHTAAHQASILRRLVRDRASGKPLQYILGTEFFGDLEIACRPGVLIPRQETAASITHLTHLLLTCGALPRSLRVLDLCTGTGCIPLLFRHELLSARNDTRLQLLGIDISPSALALAKHNAQRLTNDTPHISIEFLRSNILSTAPPDSLAHTLTTHSQPTTWEILISNPPYISPSAFWKSTTRSVRGFEPKLALVPPALKPGIGDTEQGDVFYSRLLAVAEEVGARVVLVEVADLEQAGRVARIVKKKNVWDGVEIWRDWPDGHEEEQGGGDEERLGCKILGSGNGRSVVFWREEGRAWLGK
ncbi:S-adenosyl-L-methionine-dependent methyltransferase [Sporormia fimetaria CBS 119925]|uniref:S-adenosyl-L-methionine-dependent methyltransferase n=1 Tax=Sporormia fimetaria CBS 119925 TaxID=1340428 RepID=A0A6A6V4B9_9PLEO|nr:S-adenosyl-L-methionine-dependent methyltransferase [Sporormia fimetaria CBS 119925]